jgi:6-phosphogluconolactonase (cycloisomerase 2 family)
MPHEEKGGVLMEREPRRWSRIGVSFVAVAALLALAPRALAEETTVAGNVYAMTNAAAGNEVVVFERLANGTLNEVGPVPTDGSGTGVGLGSQSGLVLHPNGKWLFAVNAGSNDISAFAVSGNSLSLVDVQSSGGDTPISLTVHANLLYALNSGSDEISGFRIAPDGSLSALAGSTRPLSGAGTDPAQVQFSPNGDLLVVTEKATNLIDTYTVSPNGLAKKHRIHASEGDTPFGFAFQARHLIVSEAFGGAVGASALSSYYAPSSGALSPVSVSVPDTQTAACWVVVTKNGRYAYTTNTGSNNVSSYTIAPDGSLALMSAVAGTTGAAPADAALSMRSRFLYTLNGADGTISAFQVQGNGSLIAIAGAAGLPAGSASGLAAS